MYFWSTYNCQFFVRYLFHFLIPKLKQKIKLETFSQLCVLFITTTSSIWCLQETYLDVSPGQKILRAQIWWCKNFDLKHPEAVSGVYVPKDHYSNKILLVTVYIRAVWVFFTCILSTQLQASSVASFCHLGLTARGLLINHCNWVEFTFRILHFAIVYCCFKLTSLHKMNFYRMLFIY